uniref:Secreted protein n=1 Tax=Plectus sambesii TaxID=2011161 RepID=A0A914W620_9BILA
MHSGFVWRGGALCRAGIVAASAAASSASDAALAHNNGLGALIGLTHNRVCWSRGGVDAAVLQPVLVVGAHRHHLALFPARTVAIVRSRAPAAVADCDRDSLSRSLSLSALLVHRCCSVAVTHFARRITYFTLRIRRRDRLRPVEIVA